MNHPIAIDSNSVRLARERAANVRRGIPAIAVGIIAMVLLIYSWTIARPKIQSSYRRQCDLAMSELELNPFTGANPNKIEANLSLEEQRKKLSVIKIYLKRLTGLQPNDENVRLQSGLVTEASSRLSARSAIEALRAGDTKKAEALRSQEIAERKSANEIIESVSQKEGAVANDASAWRMERALEIPLNDSRILDGLATKALKILESTPSNRIALKRLGQIRLFQAYDLNSELDHQKREWCARDALGLLSRIEAPTTVELAFVAESLDALNAEEAIQASIRATQQYWESTSNPQVSPESLAALFGCLLRLGSLHEAQAAILENLPKLAPAEQAILRGLCTEFCIRSIVSQIEFPLVGRRSTSMDALSLAIHLDSSSPKLVELLHRLVKVDESDSMLTSLSEILANSGDFGVKHMISATKAALAEDWTTSRTELQASLKLDPLLGTIGGFLATRMVDENLAPVSFGMRFLEQLARVSPDSLNLWYTRAVYCEKHGELEKAIECFERIHEKNPRNLSILEALESLYSRLSKIDDVSRIQRLKQTH